MTGLFNMYQDMRVKAGVGVGGGGDDCPAQRPISLLIQVYNRSHTDVLHIYKAKVHIKH